MFYRSLLLKEVYGFIGLGQMGSRMAANLLISDKSDCTELRVFDESDKAKRSFVESEKCKKALSVKKNISIKVCESPAEVATNATKIITMLPNDKIVDQVYSEPKDGIFAGIRQGINELNKSVFITDSSTVDPSTPKRLHSIASKIKSDKNENCKVIFVDAPVSGSTATAEAGTLAFMVGCSLPSHFEMAKSVLGNGVLGNKVVNCGFVGAGQVCKLCNNLIVAQQMIAVSEGMLLGTRLGIDPLVLADIFNNSTARCWCTDTNNPYPGVCKEAPATKFNYKNGFSSLLMLKDLKIAINVANREAKMSALGGALHAHDLYAKACSDNLENSSLDFSSIIKYIDTIN